MNKKKIAILSLGHFSVDLFAGFLRPILPLLMAKFGIGIFAASLLSSISGAVADFSQPVFGYFSDKLKRPYFILAGPVLAGFFIPLLGVAPTYYTALLFAFLGGLGVAAYHPQGAATVGIHAGKRVQKGMAYYVTAGSIGFAVGPGLVVLLVSFKGLKGLTFSMIFPVILIFFIYKYLRNEEVASKKTVSLKSAFINVKGPFFILVFIVTLRAFIIMSFTTFIPMLIVQKGSSVSFGGLTLFLFHLFGSAGGFAGGLIADRVGAKKVIITSFLMTVPFLYYYLFLDGIASLIILCIGAFLIFLSVPVVVTYAQTIMPSHIGTISSFMMGFCWGLASFMIAPIGALAEKFGIQNVLQIIALSAVLGVLGSMFLKRNADGNGK